ncbi:MAG TPA: ribosome maturation factor RimM [Baekduia sp.]|nr:ribosome maturation factor RimM [Baekduia sp.]
MAERSARDLVAGRVGRPHGLDGSFHVTGSRARLLQAVDRVRLGEEELAIERRAGTADRPILRLEGIATREAAEAVRGGDLVIARDAAPPLEEGEFWAEDFPGCAVVDGERAVGTVRALLAYPSCELLEVERDGGGAPLLVPLVDDAVRELDLEARRIDVDLAFLGEA